MANKDLDTLLSILDEDDETNESNFFSNDEGSVTETDASYVTANETMTHTKEPGVHDRTSEFLGFDDDVFLSDDVFDDRSSISEGESSFRTCNQTVIHARDENKTPVPEYLDLDEEEENALKSERQSMKSNCLRTPRAVKAELMAELASRKEPVTVVKKERNNSHVFLGDLSSKADNLKKALTKKEDNLKAFDPLFGIRVKDPKISSSILSTYCTGFTKYKLSHLRPSNPPKGDWVTMGVIVEKAEYRKSAKNNEYMIWKLSDLISFQDTPVRVLLFGSCIQEHWKLQEGSVITLMNPQFAESMDNKGVTLKLSKAAQVVYIGVCPDFGRCKGIKADGNRCSQYVNITSTEYCVYHITKAARTTSARRGALNSEFNSPIGRRINKPLNHSANDGSSPHVFIRAGLKKDELLAGESKSKTQKHLSKEEIRSLKEAESAKLEALKANRFNYGAKNVKLIQNKDDPVSSPTVDSKAEVKPSIDLKAFLKEQLKRRASSSRPPLMELVIEQPMNVRKARADLNRQRLAEKIRQEGGLKKVDPNRLVKPKKRPIGLVTSDSDKENQETEPKKGKFTSSNGKVYSDKDIDALLNKKSIHEEAIQEVEKVKEDFYFRSMEVREKIETKLTETMEIKDVKVVTCKKCNYTSQKQSSFCMIQGHLVQWHKGTKKFFKCQSCKQRVTTFEIIPTKPCEKCGSTSFDRVGMVDERKVEQNKLIIRGEERKFVNR